MIRTIRFTLGCCELSFVLALVLALLTTTPVSASPPAPAPDALVARPSAGPASPQELEAFLGEFLARRMESGHVPGLVFIMVKDGGVFLAKGYGHADIPRQIPMTPQSALRAGSVSKVVTASAVMQLVERGRVDLDAPVERYLTALNLVDGYGKSSTVAQLLTHTAGYDDTILRTHAASAKDWLPLGPFLQRALPPRAMPPGQVVAYSSWDYTLLGLLIETVAGMPYQSYIAANIFDPLGMRDSTFAQPLPPRVAEKLSTGYRYAERDYQAIPLDWVKISPGVALVTTGDDMAKYLLALLGEGQYGGARILNAETAQTMLQRQVTHHRVLRGYSYGAVEVLYNGQRALQQDGNGIGFCSRLVMMPQHGLGFFIALNAPAFSGPMGALSAQIRVMRELSDAFFDRYFPAPRQLTSALQPPVPLPQATERTARYAVYYRTAKHSRHTFLKLEALLDQVAVRSNRDGSLQIGSGRYLEIEPLLFQLADGRETYAVFRQGGDGKITHLLFGGSGSYERVPWFQTTPVQLGAVAMIVLLFLSAVVGWPSAYLRRRSTDTSMARWARLAAFLVSLLNLLFLAGFGTLMFTTDFLVFFKAVPRALQTLLVVPILTTAITFGMAIFAVLAWAKRWSPLTERLHYTSLTLAALVFVFWLHFWNLLGWRY